MKWESFTPVQKRTIPIVMETNKDIIISSDTASGKTEAAFLPILSRVEKEAVHALKVIYISPLKALINNQFERIVDLCGDMDIPIHRWHGDISASKKKGFTDNPSGILQITPESIESLFVNRANYLHTIFKKVEYIIIDEIHSFIGSERGVQLRSLLERLVGYYEKKPRIIGLSATIGNFNEVKMWVSPENTEAVEVIQSTGYDKKLLYSLMYFSSNKSGKPPMSFYQDIRELTRSRKAIIFVNNRSGVEELTHILNRLSVREDRGECYYPHHSSIDKKLREHVEQEMVKSISPKSIISTSTLELGIDIGDVDLVIQVDNTITVSSLKQRLGRSGRKKGSNQILQLYATGRDSFLQSLAVMELNLEGWIEPAKNYKVPYDIAFHQIISICAKANGMTLTKLLEDILQISVFKTLNKDLVKIMIMQMIENDILEELQDTKEIIIGLRGEKILRSKDFYAVFYSPEMFTVYNKTKKVGTLDRNPSVQTGSNVILAGKLWTITEVNDAKNKVYVTFAVNGEPPAFTSRNIQVHPKIHEKMLDILLADNKFEYSSEEGIALLYDLRKSYHDIQLASNERPVWIQKNKVLFEPFAGTVVSKTLNWMIKTTGLDARVVDSLGRILISDTSQLEEKIKELYQRDWSTSDILDVVMRNELFRSKYTDYLPNNIVYKMHAAHEIDLEGALKFLEENKIKLIDLEKETLTIIGK